MKIHLVVDRLCDGVVSRPVDAFEDHADAMRFASERIKREVLKCEVLTMEVRTLSPETAEFQSRMALAARLAVA